MSRTLTVDPYTETAVDHSDRLLAGPTPKQAQARRDLAALRDLAGRLADLTARAATNVRIDR